MKRKTIILLLIIFLVILAGSFCGYTAWNAANPEKTCANCHEIQPSFASWELSSHREIACNECHGTALSNGFHSISEKGSMVISHIAGETYSSNIHLTESQVIETMDNCLECHQEEYKKWLSGGHSANYSHIFLNAAHNSMEQPYWDCFRCHGMMYEGNIYDLIEPLSNQSPWRLKDIDQQNIPAIPCMTCHQIHTSNNVRSTPGYYHQPGEIFYARKQSKKEKNSAAGLYIRSDRTFLRADQLPDPEIFLKGEKLETTSDPVQRLCTQCHAPNFRHEAGTQDDLTPAGVHKELSCASCHENHSNSAVNSCSLCHPAISNCKLDVTTMNTTYYDKESENNIHYVGCGDCHDEGFLYKNHKPSLNLTE